MQLNISCVVKVLVLAALKNVIARIVVEGGVGIGIGIEIGIGVEFLFLGRGGRRGGGGNCGRIVEDVVVVSFPSPDKAPVCYIGCYCCQGSNNLAVLLRFISQGWRG